jgi:hypothetical protein
MPHRLKHWHTEAVHVTEVARTYFLLARDQTKTVPHFHQTYRILKSNVTSTLKSLESLSFPTQIKKGKPLPAGRNRKLHPLNSNQLQATTGTVLPRNGYAQQNDA